MISGIVKDLAPASKHHRTRLKRLQAARSDGKLQAMEILITILAIIVGAMCGVMWVERRDRLAALERIRETDKIHKEAVEALAKVQEKVIAEHTALMDKVNALDHVIANRNQGPLVRSFNPKI